MKQYLTISEFAGLRNVNINSIRYYEKQKFLMPAWIDPQTKYRYYLPEQLGMLDMILLCIKLGIPLKELKEYIDQSGKLDEKIFLENGKRIMQERISDIQLGLEITQFNLNNMEQNLKYRDQSGLYTREIEERFYIEVPFCGNWNDLVQKEKTAMKLFQDAQAQNMAPVFPAGILVHCDTTPVSYSFFVQILHPSKENKQIVRVPKMSFYCMQVDLTSETDIQKVLEQNFPMQIQCTAIISNMILDKFYFNSWHSEIQVPQFAF